MFSHTNHPRIVLIPPRFKKKKHEEHLEGGDAKALDIPSFDPRGDAQTTPIRTRGC